VPGGGGGEGGECVCLLNVLCESVDAEMVN
jgi:hypothetical protein